LNWLLEIRDEAIADINIASAWYDLQRPGLGLEFYAAVRAAMRKLPNNPLQHRIRVRRWRVRWAYPHPRRFPYRIMFVIENDVIRVYAVVHAARHDRSWLKRFK
jgi:hypothetical protein